MEPEATESVLSPLQNMDNTWDNPCGKLTDVVWGIVFSYLPSTDLVSCMKTGASMKKLVALWRRPEYLPPKALELILDDLDREDLLNCRLVCKLWKRSVDHVLENLPVKKLTPWFKSEHIGFSKRLFFTGRDIECFLEETRGRISNPLIGRNVTITNVIREPDYWEYVLRLFQCMGDEIYHVILDFGHNTDDQSGTCSLKSLLDLLPNLKTLCLTSSVYHVNDTLSSSGANYNNNTEARFPQLNKLEILMESYKINVSLFNEIIHHCVNKDLLGKLTITPREFDRDLDLPNLTFLNLYVSEPKELECLNKITSPLKHIHIFYQGEDNDNENGTWSDFDLKFVLSKFGKFGGTLESIFLRISFPPDYIDDNDLPPFPVLKTFSVFYAPLNPVYIPTFAALQDLILTDTYNPIDEGFSRMHQVEYLVSVGKADPHDLKMYRKYGAQPGTDQMLDELRGGSLDIWNRITTLKRVLCNGYRFRKP